MRAPHDEQWIRETFPELTETTLLAAGGQKTVYSATHARHGPCVVKFFHIGTDTGRVEREVAAIKAIQCPRVPLIYETGTARANGTPVLWLIEQRVPGVPLRTLIDNGQPLSDSLTLCIARHVLEALAEAEERRIVHRDVKPENIMVDPATERAWLLDFGIARHLDLTSLTATANVFGPCTAGYAPPEQFRNLKLETDSRSDLFSLGVTLYEMVEGGNPYTVGARDAREKMLRVLGAPLQPIRRGLGSNDAFRDLVTALTRTRRHQRPPSAAEALAWLNEVRLNVNDA